MKKILLLVLISTSAITTTAQTIDFPDENFKNALLNQATVIGTNGDGEIQIEEAENATLISTTGNDIADIIGVETFTNLEILDCSTN